MEGIGALFATHPQRPPNPSLIEACAAACYECGGLCAPVPTHAWARLAWPTSSAASEPASTGADVCIAARIVLRLTEPSPMLVEAQLMACAEACRICAAECERHAAMHGDSTFLWPAELGPL